MCRELVEKLLNFGFRHARVIEELRCSAEKLVHRHPEKVGEFAERFWCGIVCASFVVCVSGVVDTDIFGNI